MLKKALAVTIIGILLLSASCGNTMDGAQYIQQSDTQNMNTQESDEFANALSDWIDGSDFGIVSGSVDKAQRKVVLGVCEDMKLTKQDEQDIHKAVADLLDHHNIKGYIIIINNDIIAESEDITKSNIAPLQASGSTVNLIFIHHSCGENWLNDGLNQELNESGYHVADISYGWDIYGDNTDTTDLPTWFTNGVMNLVYNEKDTISASNSIAPNDGENEIIMFKSCFPNSDVGNSIQDEKAIYDSLIPYFEKHPDKMFILVTPPPMMHISTPHMTRELCNWLVNRDSGWLKRLSTNNVFVFDFYNILTHPDAHHYVIKGEEVHTYIDVANELYYDSDGDDHPNLEGNKKAANEFMCLLKFWRQQYLE